MTRYFIYLGLLIIVTSAFMRTEAATLYLEDGTQIELEVGEKVYISNAPAWSFTKFDEGGFDLRPIIPTVEVTEVCESGFTFGGGSSVCDEEVVVEEPEEDETDCTPDGLTFGGGC
jgi:hypothetical protein